MRGWLILSVTLLIGIALGIGAAARGPAFVAPYLPKTATGASTRIVGQVVRKQRDGTRLLVKVDTAQGPLLAIFTQKVADLDVLLDPGDTVTLVTSVPYETFVNDPMFEGVKSPGRATPAPAPTTPPGNLKAPAPYHRGITTSGRAPLPGERRARTSLASVPLVHPFIPPQAA